MVDAGIVFDGDDTEDPGSVRCSARVAPATMKFKATLSQIAIGEGKHCPDDCRFVGRRGPDRRQVQIACAICSTPVTP
jgi:hypothetical protein